jgi:hypothetical protein
MTVDIEFWNFTPIHSIPHLRVREDFEELKTECEE